MPRPELRELVLSAVRDSFPRKPDAVADQVARWFERADALPAEKPAADRLCAYCLRADAAIWASAQADHSVLVSRERGSATIGVCTGCLTDAHALRSQGVPRREDIRRRVRAELERQREPEALAELERALAIAPALTSDVRDAVCSVCADAVSFKLVAGGRARICDACLKRMAAG